MKIKLWQHTSYLSVLSSQALLVMHRWYFYYRGNSIALSEYEVLCVISIIYNYASYATQGLLLSYPRIRLSFPTTGGSFGIWEGEFDIWEDACVSL